ncbi:MAG TPA: CBS and ACT domain-containing protein [Syntrophobacteraceae bacterium]|nr:CBS and ACT domain-containing protein [Syntrophobacteraceae bacterium]
MFIDKSMTTDVITIRPETSIAEASELLVRNRVRHLPIIDEDGKLLGIVTDRDIRSAMPSTMSVGEEADRERERISRLEVRDIMTRKVVTLSPMHTLEDALLLMQRTKVGAFPVVDPDGRLVGILSVRDLMRAFINVLGIEEPGTLLGIVVEDKIGQMKRIVDAITEEGISFGSILVARIWEEGKRAVFPYLLTHNVGRVKAKLEDLGFTLLNPMQWSLHQLPKKTDKGSA